MTSSDSESRKTTPPRASAPEGTVPIPPAVPAAVPQAAVKLSAAPLPSGGGALPVQGNASTLNPPAKPTAGSPPPRPVSKAAPPRPIPVAKIVSGKKSTSQIDVHYEEEAFDLGAETMRYAPPWLISAVVHFALFIILALWAVSDSDRDKPLLFTFSDHLGDPNSDDPFSMDSENDADSEVILNDLKQVADPLAAPPIDPKTDFNPLGLAASNSLGKSLMGRTPGMKDSLLQRGGGDRFTEQAVQDGLAWLAKQQRKDGSWTLSGPFTNGTPPDFENRAAATGLALLAFQGVGDTHLRGTYKENVIRGWKFLLSIQDEEGRFYDGRQEHAHMYGHGMASIALCELYAMTQDTKFREPATKAVRYCLRSQNSRGGWRYRPQGGAIDRDISVSGWIMMALQSARMGGIEVPDADLERFSRFLDEAAHEGGSRYGYLVGDVPSPAMTAEGLLCRQYLGWEQSDPRLLKGAAYLLEDENLPTTDSTRNIYYWYYATQVLHHLEGDQWEKWHAHIKPLLLSQQVKAGPEAGSWSPIAPSLDQWGQHGGRLYTTCLSIFMLEVYYRHLPLYSTR